jgi:hypothetical protein
MNGGIGERSALSGETTGPVGVEPPPVFVPPPELVGIFIGKLHGMSHHQAIPLPYPKPYGELHP